MIVYIVFIIGDDICNDNCCRYSHFCCCTCSNIALSRNWWGLIAVVIHMISILPILILRAMVNIACEKGWCFVLWVVNGNFDAVFAFGLITFNIYAWYRVIISTPADYASGPNKPITDKYKNL